MCHDSDTTFEHHQRTSALATELKYFLTSGEASNMHFFGKKLYMPSGNIFKQGCVFPKFNNRLQFARWAAEDVRPKYVTHALRLVPALKNPENNRG
jgi:hypothetical protein